ncbi:ribonuclease like 2 precursor-like [Arapaima gigas]
MQRPSLLFFLVATMLVTLTKGDIRYEKFLRQHYGKTVNEHDCTKEMKLREIYNENDNTCKEVNTFIVSSTIEQIKAICDKAGEYYGRGNLYRSIQPFPVVTCKLRRGRFRNHCEYRTGTKSTRYLVLGCENKLPVHYEEGTLY